MRGHQASGYGWWRFIDTPYHGDLQWFQPIRVGITQTRTRTAHFPGQLGTFWICQQELVRQGGRLQEELGVHTPKPWNAAYSQHHFRIVWYGETADCPRFWAPVKSMSPLKSVCMQRFVLPLCSQRYGTFKKDEKGRNRDHDEPCLKRRHRWRLESSTSIGNTRVNKQFSAIKANPLRCASAQLLAHVSVFAYSHASLVKSS